MLPVSCFKFSLIFRTKYKSSRKISFSFCFRDSEKIRRFGEEKEEKKSAQEKWNPDSVFNWRRRETRDERRESDNDHVRREASLESDVESPSRSRLASRSPSRRREGKV